MMTCTCILVGYVIHISSWEVGQSIFANFYFSNLQRSSKFDNVDVIKIFVKELGTKYCSYCCWLPVKCYR